MSLFFVNCERTVLFSAKLDLDRAVWKWSGKSGFPGAFPALLVNLQCFIFVLPDLFPSKCGLNLDTLFRVEFFCRVLHLYTYTSPSFSCQLSDHFFALFLIFPSFLLPMCICITLATNVLFLIYSTIHQNYTSKQVLNTILLYFIILPDKVAT